jgi:hypothetical protein
MYGLKPVPFKNQDFIINLSKAEALPYLYRSG